MANCKPGKILNPATGRCVNINGKIGMAIVKLAKSPKTPKTVKAPVSYKVVKSPSSKAIPLPKAYKDPEPSNSSYRPSEFSSEKQSQSPPNQVLHKAPLINLRNVITSMINTTKTLCNEDLYRLIYKSKRVKVNHIAHRGVHLCAPPNANPDESFFWLYYYGSQWHCDYRTHGKFDFQYGHPHVICNEYEPTTEFINSSIKHLVNFLQRSGEDIMLVKCYIGITPTGLRTMTIKELIDENHRHVISFRDRIVYYLHDKCTIVIHGQEYDLEKARKMLKESKGKNPMYNDAMRF